MTRADVKIKITLARSFQRWTRILITQKCPITTPEQTAAQPTSLMEPASTGLHSIWWCCSSCASWQCTWRGGSLRWFTHAAGNLSNPNPTPHQPGSPFGYSLQQPTLCDSCRQAQLLAALQLLSLSGIPATVTWELRPSHAVYTHWPPTSTLRRSTSYQPVHYQPDYNQPGLIAMRGPAAYDSDSSSVTSGPRVRHHMMHGPLQAPANLHLYFHSVGSQVEAPDPSAEVPPGYRLLGRTANHRLIVERVHPWRALAWEAFARTLRVVGAIGIYLSHGIVRCICGSLVRVYRFITKYICAIPRNDEAGPVHALALADYEPGPASSVLFSPPDLHQVGGSGPLVATNQAEAEYTRRTVSRVIQPVEELSPDEVQDSSSDTEDETSSSMESTSSDGGMRAWACKRERSSTTGRLTPGIRHLLAEKKNKYIEKTEPETWP